MRIPRSGVLAAALLLCSAGAVAEDAPPTTPPPPATPTTLERLPPPQQSTVVHGTAPAELVGRWLVMGWVELPNGQVRNTNAFWEIDRQNEQVVMTHRFVTLPPALQQAMDAASNKGEAWRPTPEDVATVGAAWDSLPAIDSRLLTVQNEIFGRDGFDDAIKTDPQTSDAIWVARQVEKYHRSAAPTVQTINVFGAMEPRDSGHYGTYVTATIAAAPFPIPITFKGHFQSYRLDAGAGAARRGFLARLFDFLTGCGRR